jgi:hypothetical protein
MLDERGVCHGQPFRAFPLRVFASAVVELALMHTNRIGPELPDLLHGFLLGTLGDRKHRGHGSDAEDHAEHREERPQLVGADAAQPDPQALGVAKGLHRAQPAANRGFSAS